MNENSIQRLARVVGYPVEEIDGKATSQTFSVDGYEVRVEATTLSTSSPSSPSSPLRLTCPLEVQGEVVLELLKYAAGRMLKEQATLAYDAEKKNVFLWDEIPAGVSEKELKVRFGAFLDSCDWWRDRVQDLAEKPFQVPEMVIRP